MATPPLSYGYPKAALDAAHLPIWLQPLSRFSVAGPSDWEVTRLPSIDRGLTVAAGEGSGDGVTDFFEESDTLALPYPSMASQWYLIVRRRNWAGFGTTKTVAIPGTSERKMPIRSDQPGVESDHPLALVRVTQKDTTVQDVVDLRVWANNGGVEAKDRLVLDFLNTPGSAVKIGSVIAKYELVGNGAWGWRDYVAADPTAPLFRHGYKVVTTNNGGYCTVPYATPFPNRTEVAIPVPMDPPGGSTVIRFVSGEQRAANFRVFASTGEALPNARVGIGYIATGY